MNRTSSWDHINDAVFEDWYGYSKPLNLERNVSLAEIWVNTILEQSELLEGIDEQVLIGAWRETVGAMIADLSVPHSLKHKVLTLKVTQPSMRFHLEQIKPMLLKKIQTILGSDHVETIRFVLG